MGALSVSDAVSRAADSRVSTAMSYNIGDVNTKRMIQLEVDTHGKHSLHQITGPYFHANRFRHLRTRQFADRLLPTVSRGGRNWNQRQWMVFAIFFRTHTTHSGQCTATGQALTIALRM